MTHIRTPQRTVVIIGAGPAGLTAALELVRRSNIKPIVLEALDDVGGISRTVEYKGNRMDIGGHRFFSKSDWVMGWWREIMPLPASPPAPSDPLNFIPKEDRVLLLRSRLSRIFFLRKFFDYPISLSMRTMANLGPWRLIKIGLTYTWASLFRRKPERHLEDFFVNRFGLELYRTFFKDYTEKVWGVPCNRISPDWGAQRVKGLSVLRALHHAAKNALPRPERNAEVSQKNINTSLIERFLYPKFGPGQMWQLVKEKLIAAGGNVRHGCVVTRVTHCEGRITGLGYRDATGTEHHLDADFVISTMPVKDLVNSMSPAAPNSVSEVANGLMYRDFITVGMLLRRLKPQNSSLTENSRNLLPDTWIYIQEPDVKLGRLQIFNNWSPALVSRPDTVWLGLEYFCQEGDDLWQRDDASMGELAALELERIGIIDRGDVLDFHVVRVPKAYPAYFGTYGRFDEIRSWLDAHPNLYLIGRNGMHRYNNQDHSMLTAKLAVDAILSGNADKHRIWQVNVDDEYHEEK